MTQNSQKLLNSMTEIMQGKNRYSSVHEVIESATTIYHQSRERRISTSVQEAILHLGKKDK